MGNLLSSASLMFALLWMWISLQVAEHPLRSTSRGSLHLTFNQISEDTLVPRSPRRIKSKDTARLSITLHKRNITPLVIQHLSAWFKKGWYFLDLKCSKELKESYFNSLWKVFHAWGGATFKSSPSLWKQEGPQALKQPRERVWLSSVTTGMRTATASFPRRTFVIQPGCCVMSWIS